MTPRPLSSDDPLASRDTKRTTVSERRSPRDGALRPARPGDEDDGAPWLGSEAGAVLERQLLLASAAGEPRSARGRRWLARLALPAVLTVLAAGAVTGGIQGYLVWQREMGALQGRMGSLERESRERSDALLRGQEAAAREILALKEEAKGQVLRLETTAKELAAAQDALRSAERRQGELEAAYRALEAWDPAATLKQFVPGWLFPAR